MATSVLQPVPPRNPEQLLELFAQSPTGITPEICEATGYTDVCPTVQAVFGVGGEAYVTGDEKKTLQLLGLDELARLDPLEALQKRLYFLFGEAKKGKRDSGFDPERKEEAISEMQQMAEYDPNALRLLAKRLGESDPDFRDLIQSALVYWGENSIRYVVPQVYTLWPPDTSGSARTTLIAIGKKVGEEKIILATLPLAISPRAVKREAFAKLMGEISIYDYQAASSLANLTNDEYSSVRLAAATALEVWIPRIPTEEISLLDQIQTNLTAALILGLDTNEDDLEARSQAKKTLEIFHQKFPSYSSL